MTIDNRKNWAARGLIGLVFVFNVQCALLFLAVPQAYTPAFELSGPVGEGMLRGMGILFLMWNVPYAVALYNPHAHRTSLYEAIAMQAIGVLGETVLLLTFPAGHLTLQDSITRFIVFDGSGLVLLLLASRL
ncbi:MAG TPA: hypothetical protein VMS73_05715 [Anaerolineaceae bacterium]|nr:hypothetical protein [Anaerolineaceae bacterium]